MNATDPTDTPLPGPAERPQADVVVFDGHCRICTAQVQRLARWDWGRRLSYVSLHDPLVKALCPELSHDDLMQQMYVVDRHGRRHGGAAAIRYLSRRLPTLWWAAPLLHFPGSLPFWQWCYRQVANRRYRLGGMVDCPDGACAIHYRPAAKKAESEPTSTGPS